MQTISRPECVIYGLSCACHPDAGIRYIGQTRQGPATRLREHLKNSRAAGVGKVPDTPAYRWIRKHGGENILVTVLEHVPTVDLLNERETFWIKALGTHERPGLNCNVGGGGRGEWPRASGAKLSDAEVADILGRIWNGELPVVVARDLGISNSMVFSIVHFRSYRDVPRPVGPPRCPKKESGLPHGRAWTAERTLAMSKRFSGTGNPMYGKTNHLPDSWFVGASERTRGSNNPASKITESDVGEIRKRHATGETQTAIARDYGVSISTVGKVVNRKTWKHLD